MTNAKYLGMAHESGRAIDDMAHIRQSVQRQRLELSQAGINTCTLSESERRLKTLISETNGQLELQRASLARVSAQHSRLNGIKNRYQSGTQLAGSITAAGAVGIGVASELFPR